MSLRLTFIGPPGSGKGTQAKLLQERGFRQVSTGDMLRAEIAAGTPRGLAIKTIVDGGGLVSDAVMFEVVGEYLARHAEDAIVFDGYPRTLAQAQQLARLRLDGAVFFEVPDEVLLRRLGDRVIGPDGTIYDLLQHPPPPGVAVTRRADDDPALHRKRLAEYRVHERELRDFYQRAGLAHSIDAAAPLDQVRSQVNGLVGRLAASVPTAV